MTLRGFFIGLFVLLTRGKAFGADDLIFERDIAPILKSHCVKCHGDEKQQGGLRFDSRAGGIKTGDSGEASITPGHPEKSEILRRVTTSDETLRMPPKGDPLSPSQVELVRRWILAGARWPDDGTPSSRSERKEMVVTDDDRAHWAYRPLQKISIPAVKNPNWNQTPIDQFILARLEASDLQPSPPIAADKLMRRVYFDLIGLPPIWSVEEGGRCEQWLSLDSVPDMVNHGNKSFSEFVNRILESPHYGERWGRHWLDVARYADSDGQESDRDRPNAFHYRDFVIRSLNSDMPFDTFVRWQLAGDEYEPDNPEAVAATGFLTAGTFAALPDNLMADERLRTRYNELDDVVSTIGTGLLGLTFACARCHDHKYDAIPSRDYYRILSAFHSGERTEVTLENSNQKIFAFRDFGPDPKPSWLFRRGDYYDHELPVSLGFLSVLTRDKSPEDYWKESQNTSSPRTSTRQRRALAEWLTDTEHGAGALLARVIVNRIWQHHFGQGLVRTTGDFGVRSEASSHPHLLEWLAQDFVQHGWKLKRLHRMILMSATYQQASAGIPASTIDPDNRLLWKRQPQRLEAEILRDSMLGVSGTLNLKAFGPGFKPPIAAEAILARNLKDAYPSDIKDSLEVRRRSVYMFHKRVVPNPLLAAFDKPDSLQSCNRREPTTVAPQALALLNDPFVRDVSFNFADRLIGESSDLTTNIARGYELALSRSPGDGEQAVSREFVESQMKRRRERDESAPLDDIRRRSLADWCQILFSLNEFLYID